MKLKTTFVFLLSLFSFTFYQVQAQCNGATFVENNGIAVIEAETASLPSNWKKRTSKTPFTGSSYIFWDGSNSFSSSSAGSQGVVDYKVKINNPGKYRFVWRNVIGIVASHNPTTEHNDSWLKFPDADDFYGQKGSSKIWPKGSGKSPNPDGASGNGYFKVYANSLNWNWSTFTSDFNGHFVYAEFDSPGVYTIRLAARSKGHIIDRMVLYKEGQYSASQAQSLSRSETRCDGSTPPPPPPPGGGDTEVTSIKYINADTDNTIGTLTNGATINKSNLGNPEFNFEAITDPSTVGSVKLVVSGPLNNTRTENGKPYTAFGDSGSNYFGRDLPDGSYSITATPYSGSSASGTSGTAKTISFTVVSGGGTPPPPPPPGENEAPTVVITNPADGENFSAGSTVTVNVSANDADGSVTKHQVYVNNVLKDTDGSNYTPHKITNITNGNYAIKVTVTDNDGATASATVNITVGSGNPPPPPPPSGDNNPPTVSITSPSEGQNFDVGSTVTVKVSANDSDGTVTKHQVYVNDKLKDTDGSNYTPYKITDIAQGNHVIKVTVTDNEGATASATVNISVGSGNPPPPPPSGNDISLTLVNATSNSDNGALTNGTNVSSGSNINVRADVANSNVKSVFMKLRGATTRNQTENVVPFALFGDSSGNYFNGTLNGGSHTLTVEAYSGLNRSGSLLETLVVSFTVASGGKSAIAYPNPVKQGNVNVRLPETITGVAGYTILSPSGTEVERGSIDASKMGDAKLLQIDSANMKNDGVYYLVIQANYDVFTVPIIKQ